MPPKFQKALSRMSFALRRPSTSSVDGPSSASSVKAPSVKGRSSSPAPVERADRPSDEVSRKASDDTPVSPSVHSALVAGDEVRPSAPQTPPTEYVPGPGELSLASPDPTQVAFPNPFPPPPPPAAKVLEENGHLHDEPESLKAQSIKAQSIKPQSIKAPSVKAPSVKAPSVKAPSIKAPSVRPPSVKQPAAFVREPAVSVREPAPSVKDTPAPSTKAESIAEVTNAKSAAPVEAAPLAEVGGDTTLADRPDKIATIAAPEPDAFPFVPVAVPVEQAVVEPPPEQLEASATTIQHAWRAKKERRSAAYAAAASAAASNRAAAVSTPEPAPPVVTQTEEASQEELERAAAKIQKSWKKRQHKRHGDSETNGAQPLKTKSSRIPMLDSEVPQETPAGYVVGPVPTGAWQVGEGFGQGDGLVSTQHVWNNSSQPADSTTALIPAAAKVTIGGEGTRYYESFSETTTRPVYQIGEGDDDDQLLLTDWRAHTLPTKRTYFSNSKYNVVTDIDLRLAGNLRRVTTHLSQSGAAYGREHETPGIIAQAPELEMWLRSLHSDEFAPTTLWVDHVHKNVSVHPPSAHKKSVQEAVKDSDGHIKYWGFMETHPAHVPLPQGAMEEAMEILTWSYTDTLLNPFKNPKGSPFAPKECQELMDLMKSVKPSAEGTTASALYTRIIAKILHRVAEHRQSAFEEYHDDDAEGSGAGHHHGFKAKMTQSSKPGILMSLFCLGVPHLFVPKEHPLGHPDGHPHAPFHHPGGLDVEGRSGGRCPAAHGLPHPGFGGMVADSPVFAGGITLAAAIIMTASISFLSLPGLDSASRLACFVSLICGASSLGASAVNLQRRRQHPPHPALQQSQHYYVKSLPLLFFIWSIIALVVSAVLFSFRGDVNRPGLPPNQDEAVFRDVLKWVLVGLGSFMSFVLLVSAWVNRR